MDKVLSARVDEAVLNRMGAIARRLGLSKKKILENAVNLYANQVEAEQQRDFFAETMGAWQRKASPAETVESARKAFRKSMGRRSR